MNDLTDRQKLILTLVITDYIETAQPVGSGYIVDHWGLDVSSATVRNELVALTELGYLRQPHTSAGRVPTDVGYRFYVDTLTSEKSDTDTELVSEMNRKLDLFRKDVDSFLDNASRLLSELSHYIGISVSPNANRTILTRIELVPYRKNQIAVVLFADEAIIRSKIITVEQEMSRSDLNRLSDYINDRFSGYSLDEVRKTIIEEISNERVMCDRLISEATRICRDVLAISDSDIFISGLSEMVNLPDFCDIGRIRGLLKTLEDKHIILGLLDRISDTDGIQVFIGKENPLDEMKQFSLVAARYKEGNRPMGAIGIIGPTQ
jgi:heat-inducible transcriptional repressor